MSLNFHTYPPALFRNPIATLDMLVAINPALCASFKESNSSIELSFNETPITALHLSSLANF